MPEPDAKTLDELFNRGIGLCHDQPTVRAFMDAVHVILQRRLAQAVEWERDRMRVQMRKPSPN